MATVIEKGLTIYPKSIAIIEASNFRFVDFISCSLANSLIGFREHDVGVRERAQLAYRAEHIHICAHS